MKLIISIVLLAVTLLSSSELDFLNDYSKALSKAKKENKPIYLLITSQSCQWCRKFEETTLIDDDIKKRLSSEFIIIHLCRDTDHIPSKFKTTPIPRHYFVDTKGTIVYEALGYRNIELFDSFMDNAQTRLGSKKR